MSLSDFQKEIFEYLNSEKLFKQEAFESIEDSRIGIDALYFLQLFLKKIKLLHPFSGLAKLQFEEDFSLLMKLFEINGIKPTFVFPGTLDQPSANIIQSSMKRLWAAECLKRNATNNNELNFLCSELYTSQEIYDTYTKGLFEYFTQILENHSIDYVVAPSSHTHQLRWLYANDYLSSLCGSINLAFFGEVSHLIIDFDLAKEEIIFIDCDEMFAKLKFSGLSKDKKIDILIMLTVIYDEPSLIHTESNLDLCLSNSCSKELMLNFVQEYKLKRLNKYKHRIDAIDGYINGNIIKKQEAFLESVYKMENRVWDNNKYLFLKKKIENAYIITHDYRLIHFPRINNKSVEPQVEKIFGQFQLAESLLYTVLGIYPSDIMKLVATCNLKIGSCEADSKEYRKFLKDVLTSIYIYGACQVLIKSKKGNYLTQKYTIEFNLPKMDQVTKMIADEVNLIRKDMKIYYFNSDICNKLGNQISFKNVINLCHEYLPQADANSEHIKIIEAGNYSLYTNEIELSLNEIKIAIYLSFLHNNNYININSKSVNFVVAILDLCSSNFEEENILLYELLSLGYVLHGKCYEDAGIDPTNSSIEEKKNDPFVVILKKTLEAANPEKQKINSTEQPDSNKGEPSSSESLTFASYKIIDVNLPYTAIEHQTNIILLTIKKEEYLFSDYLNKNGKALTQLAPSFSVQKCLNTETMDAIIFISRIFAVVNLETLPEFTLEIDYDSNRYVTILNEAQKVLRTHMDLLVMNYFWNKKKHPNDLQNMLEIRAKLPFKKLFVTHMSILTKVLLARFVFLQSIKQYDPSYTTNALKKLSIANIEQEFQIQNFKSSFKSAVTIWETLYQFKTKFAEHLKSVSPILNTIENGNVVLSDFIQNLDSAI